MQLEALTQVLNEASAAYEAGIRPGPLYVQELELQAEILFFAAVIEPHQHSSREPIRGASLALLRFYDNLLHAHHEPLAARGLADVYNSRIEACLSLCTIADIERSIKNVVPLYQRVLALVRHDLAANDAVFADDVGLQHIACLELLAGASSSSIASTAQQLCALCTWQVFCKRRDEWRFAALHRSLQLFEIIREIISYTIPVEVTEYLSLYRASREAGGPIDEPVDDKAVKGLSLGVLIARVNLKTSQAKPDFLLATSELIRFLVMRHTLLSRRSDLHEALRITRNALAEPVGSLAPDVRQSIAREAGSAFAAAARESRSAVDAQRALDLLLPEMADTSTSGDLDGVATALSSAVTVLAEATSNTRQLDQVLAALSAASQSGTVTPERVRKLRAALLRTRWTTTRSPSEFEASRADISFILQEASLSDSDRAFVEEELARLWHELWRTRGSRDALSTAITLMRNSSEREPEEAQANERRQVLSEWLIERHAAARQLSDLDEATNILLRLSASKSVIRPGLIINCLVLALRTGRFPKDEQRREAITILVELATEDGPSLLPTAAARSASVAEALFYVHHATQNPLHIEAAKKWADRALQRAAADDHDANYAAWLLKAKAELHSASEQGWFTKASNAARMARRFAKQFHQRAEVDITEMNIAARQADKSLDVPDQERAVAKALKILETGETQVLRRGAARVAIVTNRRLGAHRAAAEAALTLVQSFVGDTTWSSLGLPSRRRALAEFPMVVQGGITDAVQAEDPYLAIQILERGRNVLRQHRNATTLSLKSLSTRFPDQANRIAELEKALSGLDQMESAEHIDDFFRGYLETFGVVMPDRAPEWTSPEEIFKHGGLERVQERHKRWVQDVAEHKEELRERVLRELNGIAGETTNTTSLTDKIDVPNLLHGLRPHVRRGSVVIVNVSPTGAHAIIHTQHGTRVRPLPDLNFEEAMQEYISLFHAVVVQVHEGGIKQAALDEAVRRMQTYLWRAAVSTILDDIGATSARASGRLQRVWWCLSGFPGLLPFHAAHSDRDIADESALDLVVSSYIDSLSSLTTQPPSSTRQYPSACILSIPSAHMEGLPAALREVAAVARILREHDIPVANYESSTDAVVEAISQANWLHAACHGEPNVPGKAAGGLHTSAGYISTTRLSWATAMDGELAYLSSCHSAAFSSDTPDEVEHLAAELHGIGFRHVVAYLWAVPDRAAELAARNFYSELLGQQRRSNHKIIADESAYALRSSLLSLRGTRLSRAAWVPLVHFGP